MFGEVRHDVGNGWALRGSLGHRRFDEDGRLFRVLTFEARRENVAAPVLDEYDNTCFGAPASYTLSLRLSY